MLGSVLIIALHGISDVGGMEEVWDRAVKGNRVYTPEYILFLEKFQSRLKKKITKIKFQQFYIGSGNACNILEYDEQFISHMDMSFGLQSMQCSASYIV